MFKPLKMRITIILFTQKCFNVTYLTSVFGYSKLKVRKTKENAFLLDAINKGGRRLAAGSVSLAGSGESFTGAVAGKNLL